MYTSDRKWGNVSRIFFNKGFGFIAGDDGESYFFHVHEAPEFDYLNPGDPVSFLWETVRYMTSEGDPRDGFRATRVQLRKQARLPVREVRFPEAVSQ